MGLFSTTTPFDEQLDKATNELNTEIDWGLILSLCDKVKSTPKGATEFATVILPKINHKIPHVSMQAITVLDACINNCGKEFLKVVASMPFTDGLREILYNYKNTTVTRRLRYCIRKWAEEFKEDVQLSHFVSFYYDLRGEGMEFPDKEEDMPNSKKKTEVSKDPNVVSSQQEADDIAKAIEASLKEEQQKKGIQLSSSAPTSSLYPSMLGGSTPTSTLYSGASYASSGQHANKRTVKALYDFEAAEDNELTFKAGDLLTILDDSDANWWKGEGANGAGLFPSNFVTSDLSTEPEPEVVPEPEERESVVKFNETLEVKEVNQDQPVLEINEDVIDRTLAALQSTDPETTTTDTSELLRDEESCIQMGKLIDSKLEEIDRKHLEFTLLNEKILESLQMYDNLMKKAPTFPPHRYGPTTTALPPNMMGTYPSYPNAGYMPNPGAPGPSAGMPQQMGPGPMMPPQVQAYNPMYQSGATYPMSNGNMTSIDQQQMVQQNPAYSANYQQQTTNMSSYAAQPNAGYHGNAPPIMSQYQNPAPGLAANSTPPNFSTNQVSTQPLM